MPGVADQIRRTQLKQEQQARQASMKELLRMVQEGRLHEADAMQLETLKLALELSTILEDKQVPQQIPTDELAEVIKQVIAESLANLPSGVVYASPKDDPDRPQMKHTSLADLAQSDTEVDITHRDSVSRKIEGQEATTKLEKLRKLKKDT